MANLAAFGIQGIFAILLLGLFSPEQVAVYFVVSQIAFFWHNLAMAQSNTALIANSSNNIRQAARQATAQSTLRLLLLVPAGYWALRVSAMHGPQIGIMELLLWTLLIAFFQMAWYLAQAYLLRNGTAQQSAIARVLPPLVAALCAGLGAALQWPGPVLLVSALLGFACGAWWLLNAWRPGTDTDAQAPRPATQRDDRSTMLRTISTLVDGLFFTGLAIVWQSSYGGEHAGWMLTLMRLLGFIPSLVHTAWQQVVLAKPDQKQVRSLWVALGSTCLVIAAGVGIEVMADSGVLPAQWQGLQHYALPVALWQTGACLTNTFSYLSFARGRAVLFAWLGMGLHSLCLLALLGPLLWVGTTAVSHFWLIASAYSLLSVLMTIALLKVPARSHAH